MNRSGSKTPDIGAFGGVTRDGTPPEPTAVPARIQGDAVAPREAFDDSKAHVVPRRRVLRPGIPETDDELHADSRRQSSLFSAALSPSDAA